MSLFSSERNSAAPADQIYQYCNKLLAEDQPNKELSSYLKTLKDTESNANKVISKVALNLNGRTALPITWSRDLALLSNLLRRIEFCARCRGLQLNDDLQGRMKAPLSPKEQSKYIPILKRLNEHCDAIEKLKEQTKNLSVIIEAYSESASKQEGYIKSILDSHLPRDAGDDEKKSLLK